MTENIKRLEKLVNELPILSAIVKGEEKGHTEYITNSGTCIGFGLFNDGEVGIQRAYMSKGSVLPAHHHRVKELLVVISGSISVNSDYAEDKILRQGDHVYFMPEDKHVVEALEDSWIIGVSVPSARGYPSA